MWAGARIILGPRARVEFLGVIKNMRSHVGMLAYHLFLIQRTEQRLNAKYGQ